MKRVLIVLGLIACLLAGGVFGARLWRTRVLTRLEAQAFAQTERQLREGNFSDALAVIDGMPRSDVRFQWSRLELEALVAAGRVERLSSIYSRSPNRILAHEQASQLVARVLFASRQRAEFQRLRTNWRGREVRHDLWLLLDSDLLAQEGKPRKAEELLRSRTFAGESEALRLVRLALYAAPRSLQESWGLLDRAFECAPRNTEVRSFRAQILESVGRSSEARVEYVAALVADPGNPLLRDQLGEFYRRQGNYDLALETWREALRRGAPDFIALKEAFWSRAIQPTADRPSQLQASGSLAPLIEFIRGIPQDRFWDAERFTKLSGRDRFARERPEVFWLRLLELLRTGREQDAAELLAENRFSANSWSPDVETALTRILRIRAHKSPAVPEAVRGARPAPSHPFLKELELLAKTQTSTRGAVREGSALASFVNGTNAFAGAFLAVGWRQATLTLSGSKVGPEAPAWFAYGLAQCLRVNRGNRAALDCLAGVGRSPELVLLRGELLLAEKQQPEGIRELETIATHDSDAGFRASWLLAQTALDASESDRARLRVNRQPRLVSSALGSELLARAALQEGNRELAEKLYATIKDQSVEAQAFLARRAFERKDWTAARRHTEALQRRMPDQLQLRENLVAIDLAEKANETR